MRSRRVSDRQPEDSRVAALRAAFDEAFRDPPRDVAADAVDLLAVTIGGRPHLLAMTDLVAMHRQLAVTPVPTMTPAFMGLAQIDARLVPVYDLRVLLGHPADGAAGCFVLAARESIAMALDGCDRHVRVPRATMPGPATSAPDSSSPTVMVDVGDTLLPLVSLPAVIDAIRVHASAEA